MPKTMRRSIAISHQEGSERLRQKRVSLSQQYHYRRRRSTHCYGRGRNGSVAPTSSLHQLATRVWSDTSRYQQSGSQKSPTIPETMETSTSVFREQPPPFSRTAASTGNMPPVLEE